MKLEAGKLKRGDVIVDTDGSMYTVVSAEHSMTGKRTACIQVHMKAIDQVNKVAKGSSRKRYMPNAELEVIDLIAEECIFLYTEGNQIILMRGEDRGCEQVSMALADDVKPWLADGMVLSVHFNGEQPMYFTLPKQVHGIVLSTETSSKHQRVTSSYKPAELENGVTIQVPSFIKDGDKITVDTEDDFSYVGKAKDD